MNGRRNGYQDIAALAHAGGPPQALERLADANAFGSLGIDRRRALWEGSCRQSGTPPLFGGELNDAILEDYVDLPLMTEVEQVFADLAAMAITLDVYRVSFVRDELQRLGVTPNGELKKLKNGTRVN